MAYLVSTPWWLRAIYPRLVWKKETEERVLYLTFDDGPHETATPFVLDLLRQYNAKATFFCIGKNVENQASIYNKIVAEGHSVGNHTHNHLKGWKTDNFHYIKNIQVASLYIESNLFRPPYGRIKRSQIKLLQEGSTAFEIIMWSVLSGDFDTKISSEKCWDNVRKNAKPGSIIVFHDSEKAWDRLQYALPKVLDHFTKEGYQFKRL